MAASSQVGKAESPRRGRRPALVVAGLVLAGLAWSCAPQVRDWWMFLHADALRVTVANQTSQPLPAAVVTGDMGFTLPLGDLAPGTTVTKAARFGPTQGRGHLRFRDGPSTADIEIGYLLNDDGPYAIHVTVGPTAFVVHRRCPTAEPVTWTIQRGRPSQ